MTCGDIMCYDVLYDMIRYYNNDMSSASEMRPASLTRPWHDAIRREKLVQI